MIYFGIDVTKYKHRLVAIDTEGTIFIRHLQIKNNCDVFTKHQMTLANLQKTIGKFVSSSWCYRNFHSIFFREYHILIEFSAVS